MAKWELKDSNANFKLQGIIQTFWVLYGWNSYGVCVCACVNLKQTCCHLSSHLALLKNAD